MTLVALALLAACQPAPSERNEEIPAGGEAAASHRRMLSALKKVVEETPDRNAYVGDRMARESRAALAGLPEDAPLARRWALHARLAEAELTLGNEDRALEQYEAAMRLIPEIRKDVPGGQIFHLVYRMGVAYMRVAETQNCCQRYTPESCVFPIRGRGVHVVQEPSRKAIELFTLVVDSTPEDSELYLAARWLLNIAYMTVGEHPSGVPARHLLPPDAFASEAEIPRFENVSVRVGLDTLSLAGGAIVDDFDEDLDLDVMVSSWDPAAPLRYFENHGDGSFVEKTESANLAGIVGGLNLLQADFDNDGDLDVLVLRGAWLGEAGQHPNSLLRNEGKATFVDVTFDAGLGEVHYPTQTASWADYDNDGDLDLFVGNEQDEQLAAPCQLFRNEGDGTFTDVAEAAGVTNGRFTKAVVWGDYDGDRFPDLYVSNLGQPNRLYHNNRDGTFDDVAERLGVTHPIKSFPAWFWDFDNDGWLDLFVSAYEANVADLAASYLGRAPRVELARLYRGDGRGGFEEVARRFNLTRPTAPMGSNFGDLDNDGRLDFYLGTGYPDYQDLMPNVMYLNRGERGFADVTVAGGFGLLQKGHAVVFADLDHDGDQDVFEQMGGALAGDAFVDALYENPGFGNHWLTVRLVGVTSNRSAIGARIRADVVEDGRERTVYKHVGSGGSFGASPLRQTVGLGRAERIARLSVLWPATGRTQVLHDVPLDASIEIVENEEGFSVLSLPALRLSRRSPPAAPRAASLPDDRARAR